VAFRTRIAVAPHAPKYAPVDDAGVTYAVVPTSDAEPWFGVDLYWLPLGAGGSFVRVNGRIYEAVTAWRAKRSRRDLYHSALIVSVPAGTFVIEQAWPIPSGRSELRGVVSEGPVATHAAGRFRFLRYEVRRSRDGVIADVAEAVESPQRLTDDVGVAERLLDLVAEAPTPVWGRDELGAGEMWNSNSLVSWVLARSGFDVDAVRLPSGGRAPGWDAGVVVARRQGAGPATHCGFPASTVAVVPDAPGFARVDHADMTYAVVVSTDDGPGLAGRIDLEADSFAFSGGSRVRYTDLRDIYLERRPSGPPALVLYSRRGDHLRIASLEGLGALHELAEELVEARSKTAA
jgi:hypothetical protein